MALSNYFEPITILAAILGLVQSITWFVLSLIGVLAYRCELETPKYESSSDQFPVTLYVMYFQGPTCKPVNTAYLGNVSYDLYDMGLLKPDDLHGWMASYVAFDVLYFLVSACVLFYRNNTGRRLLFLVRVWCAITLAFLVMDVWLTFEFGFDYQDVSDYLKEHNDTDKYGWLTTIPGALMAIAARGFVLWFMNLALLIYFLSYTISWSAICEPAKKKRERTERREMRGRDNDVILNDPEFRDILQSHRNRLPRASIDSWSSDKHRNDLAIVPVTHEIKRPVRAFDNPVNVGRWEEYPSAHEGVTRFSTDDIRSFPPQKKQIIWDGEPLPKPQENKFRSHGPATSADYRTNLKEHLRSATERRQREAPMSFEEDDQRIVRPNRNSDFNHDIRNFEAGNKRNGQKETKPFGQPVRVPPPPALPKTNDAYYY